MTRTSTVNYLQSAQTLRRQELIWGMVREAAAPRYFHQAVVTRLTVLLDREARLDDRGTVVVSPVDVVLDDTKDLVVQPDIVFVSAARRSLLGEWITGAPDLVIEVLSPGTSCTDRGEKLAWYRDYGVREYWMVDPYLATIEILLFDSRPTQPRRWRGAERIASSVLGPVGFSASDVFEREYS